MDMIDNTYRKVLFITVGTTEFEQLTESIDCNNFLICVNNYGYNKLVIQYGRGFYIPHFLLRECSRYNIEIEIFQFKSNLDEYMLNSNLIISHCGAGSILEAITYKKMLIVVVNNSLQGNHQLELSNALVRDDYCISTIPSQIIDAIHRIHIVRKDTHERKFFPINNPNNFSAILDNHFDFDE